MMAYLNTKIFADVNRNSAALRAPQGLHDAATSLDGPLLANDAASLEALESSQTAPTTSPSC